MKSDWQEAVFRKKLLSSLRRNNIYCEVMPYGVFVKNGFDSWVIEIGEQHNEGWNIKLYHKNVIPKSHPLKRGSYPDMHLQFSKVCTLVYLVWYIKSHNEKYFRKSNIEKSFNALSKNEDFVEKLD